MTVAELIEELQKMPPYKQVELSTMEDSAESIFKVEDRGTHVVIEGDYGE